MPASILVPVWAAHGIVPRGLMEPQMNMQARKPRIFNLTVRLRAFKLVTIGNLKIA